MNTNNTSKQEGIKISEKQYVVGYDKEAFSQFVKSKRKDLISKKGKKGITIIPHFIRHSFLQSPAN